MSVVSQQIVETKWLVILVYLTAIILTLITNYLITARSGCTSAYPSTEEARKAKVGDDSDDTEETTDNDNNQDHW